MIHNVGGDFLKKEMTLIISWIGTDSRKISSFYIASDSRFTWANPLKYDYGRKVFAFTNSPNILGYCGDVVYPTLILNQILDMDRDGILFPKDSTNIERSRIIYKELTKKFDTYPSKGVMDDSLEIIHVSRQGETDFLCNVYKWTKSKGWEIIPKEILGSSDKVIILGTGESEFYNRYLDYYRGLNGKTSRALFQCLTHSLLKMKDLKCGGSPQLVGLYNRFNGKNFGVIYENKRYYLGKEIEPDEIVNNIEWRNELFERCDGLTTKILDGAQRQPDELRP
ncbi:MAG: hypothetical protein COW03_03095 [Cytophagales bacterium CG12_big_fil_rev_8_21_14_0_65_40_12]|nr:MAG: hypothetical protein COW03_03095 [Cytophagales bacterium CG12_big_fil_rev_8_21_14_0_65_40_12]PIW05278.1 MAG: hypothetical protein COW40_05650 [Cytophagales bacterium CG17_big_fil_post_rev_8_21_14_2_50_40_13]